jgi:insertion element IS1 protein InsB
MLPKFEQSVLPAQKGDTIEADEVWSYVGSKQNPAWIWLSWSFQTTQTLSFAIGSRDEATGRVMWQGIPDSFRRKQVYTDAYAVYDKLIPASRHWVCPKGSADTNIAEGCNNYLRHRISYLVRKSSSFARKVDWLYRRLLLVLFTRNQRIKQEYLDLQDK